MIELLFDAVNSLDYYNNSNAFHTACRLGNIEIMKFIMKKNPKIINARHTAS